MENQDQNKLSPLSNNFTYNTAKMAEGHNQPELRELMEENLKYTKAVYWSTEKVRRHLMWQRIISIIYILILIGLPTVIFVYLMPYMKNMAAPYIELLQEK
ncbi:MAG: hypothetical protein V1684_02190 [bacterium]